MECGVKTEDGRTDRHRGHYSVFKKLHYKENIIRKLAIFSDDISGHRKGGLNNFNTLNNFFPEFTLFF